MAVLAGGPAAEHLEDGSKQVPDPCTRHLIPERPLERPAWEEHCLARLARAMQPNRITVSCWEQGALEDVDRCPKLPEERHHQE
jgi:hypothetical protein